MTGFGPAAGPSVSFHGAFRRITGRGVDAEKTTRMTSRPREFHPRALPEPCMTLSSHTAPDVRPLPWHRGQ
jgi:hypothetical protein